MVLTSEQVQALKEGEPVTLSPPEVGEECVCFGPMSSSGSASWCWIPRKLIRGCVSGHSASLGLGRQPR